MEPQCCYIHPVSGKTCQSQAIFTISENTRNDPDNYTHSCTKHVGVLLGTQEFEGNVIDCTNWTISLI